MKTEITNMAGQTFHLGRRVRSYDGWEGTVIEIVDRPYGPPLLRVEPDDISALPAHEAYPLNPKAAMIAGRDTFVRCRDHGATMGNFTPLDDEEA